MAFARDDTNVVYEKHFCPVLLDRGITPVRIDRLEHNDNIDDKIMQELRGAAFVIADLTYARPSVYFEAGFAEHREIPVIYTVRRDHLEAHADDPFGVLRVHFDLLMRNIIDWTDPEDPSFRSRLAGRIDRVLGPILAGMKAEKEKQQERSKFLALSYEERKRAVLNICDQVFATPDIKATVTKEGNLHFADRVGQRVCNRTLVSIMIHLLSSEDSTPQTNRSQIYVIPDEPGYNLNFGDLLSAGIEAVHEHCISLSFLPLSMHHIAEMIPNFTPLANSKALVSRARVRIPILSYKEHGKLFYPVHGNTTFGFGVNSGACVENPLHGVKSSKPLLHWHFPDSARVIECSSRELPRVQTFQVIDDIQSMASFKEVLSERLKEAVRFSLSGRE
jgi:hypothetical protein